jgi:hypothetical protein
MPIDNALEKLEINDCVFVRALDNINISKKELEEIIKKRTHSFVCWNIIHDDDEVEKDIQKELMELCPIYLANGSPYVKRRINAVDINYIDITCSLMRQCGSFVKNYGVNNANR